MTNNLIFYSGCWQKGQNPTPEVFFFFRSLKPHINLIDWLLKSGFKRQPHLYNINGRYDVQTSMAFYRVSLRHEIL